MNFTNESILKIAMQQSGVDANCAAEDFMRDENIIAISVQNHNARKYLDLPLECNLISYGNNIVASINEKYRRTVSEYINRFSIEHCFETPNLHVLDDAMLKDGLRVCFMAEYFLPDLQALKAFDCPYELKVLHSNDFDTLYTPQWSNALCEKRHEIDVLGIVAYDSNWLVLRGVLQTVKQCGRSEWTCSLNIVEEVLHQRLRASSHLKF